MNFKVPIIEKVYEAYSAISSDRVEMFEDYASVFSSDFSKKYTVKWKDNKYSSDDNASYWQGTLGYPVIAVLMLQGKLTLDREVSEYFKDIPWKMINGSSKNNYVLAGEKVLTSLQKDGIDIEHVKDSAKIVHKEIENLDIELYRSLKGK